MLGLDTVDIVIRQMLRISGKAAGSTRTIIQRP
jgi:hypothetical protein